jgi:four helix bundle protein
MSATDEQLGRPPEKARRIQVSAYTRHVSRCNFLNQIPTDVRIPKKSTGTARASPGRMSGAGDFEELVCWQRIHELNIDVSKATQDGAAGSDVKFCDQIRGAASAAERHIVDGFGHVNPLVFAYFLDFSRTAAFLTRSLLRKGIACGYFSAEHFERLDTLAVHGLQAVTSFQRYLRSPAAKRQAGRRYQRPYTAPRQKPTSTETAETHAG